MGAQGLEPWTRWRLRTGWPARGGRCRSRTGGEPTWAYVVRAGDDERYVRNASAVATKAAARYPFVEPTPFER